MIVCYDFHSRTFDDKEDLMFDIKLELFSIRTIVVLKTPKFLKIIIFILSTYIGLIGIGSYAPIEPIFVLHVHISIPHDTLKQHLQEKIFQLQVGKMTIDETHA